MLKAQLDNLLRIGKLKAEPPSEAEIAGLLHSAQVRLADAERGELGLESRFDLAYNAAHAFALAALRRAGYRSDVRYIVFQCLQHTLDLPPEQWRVLSEAHRQRNLAEYEGFTQIEESLVEALLRVTKEVASRIEKGAGD